jgi:uncharacterized protein
MFRIVEFQSEGATLRGRLYRRQDSGAPAPLVVMAHGFSAVIDGMAADRYAQVFADAGFAVLLYDHRNFGISDGEPRQEINKWIQARGYRDAMNHAATLPDVDADRMALWGDSLSAGEVLVVGSIDARVKAIVCQVPAFGDSVPPADPDGALFAALLGTFLNGDVHGTPEDRFGPLPVVSVDQRGTPSMLKPLTAFRWFLEHGGRHGTRWENWATVVNPKTPVPYSAVLCAPNLRAPVLMVVSPTDEMGGASPAIARLTFDRVPRRKEWVEVSGGHFGLLYPESAQFDEASRAQREFLVRSLI